MSDLQRTEKWFKDRAGKITSSNLKILMEGTERAKEVYLEKLLSELGGCELKSFKSKATDWGIVNEYLAIKKYEMLKNVKVKEVGFVQLKEINYYGGSPDGLVNRDGIIEVKCPYNTDVHMQTYINGMPASHYAQVQGNIFVTERKWCDFISYDPRQPEPLDIYIQRIERDEDYIKEIKNVIFEFNMKLIEKIYCI